MKEFTFYMEVIPPQFRSMEVISTQALILRMDAFFVVLATNNSLTYCDDFIIMLQYENEANMVYEEWIPRLAKFNLEINTDKTKVIPFGRYKGTKGGFDFLGFAHINGKTRNGKYTVHHTVSKKKLKAKKQSAKA